MVKRIQAPGQGRIAAGTMLKLTHYPAAVSPMLGAVSTADGEFPDVRRVLMRRTRYHVYYRVIGDVFEVLAIWHTARGEGPTLG